MINYPEKASKNLEDLINEKITNLTKKLSNDFNDIKSFFSEHVCMEESNPHQRLLNKSIKHVRLDSRTYNCLKKKKIRTIQKLISHSEEDLLTIPYLGKKCIEDIKNSLKEKNLSLR